MGKLLGGLITVAAFSVALVLVLGRRPVGERRPAGRLAARFWVLVTLFVGLLGGVSARAAEAPPKAAATELDQGRIAARPEWQALKADWLAVGSLAGFGWDEMNRRVEDSRQTCVKRMAALVGAGLVDAEASEVFCRIQADRVYHKLRATAATCYDPTQLGAKLQAHRDDFEQRLARLAALAGQGKLKPEVAEKVRQTIARQMEFSLMVGDHFASMPRDGNWDSPQGQAYRDREQALLALFAKADHRSIELRPALPVRPAVQRALALVDLIYRR